MDMMEMEVMVVEVVEMKLMKVKVMKEVEVVEVKVVVEMSAGGGPRAPGCPGLCSDTASSALVRRPSQSGSKVKENRTLNVWIKENRPSLV